MEAVITIHPYRRAGWKGWVVAVEDFFTGELWQRLLYYKVDAEQLKGDLEGKSLEEILDNYGTSYFERVR